MPLPSLRKLCEESQSPPGRCCGEGGQEAKMTPHWRKWYYEGTEQLRASSLFLPPSPAPTFRGNNTGMPKGGRRELCWLSAKGIEGQTSSAHPPPNVKPKLGRNLGVHKASPNGSSPWQKSYHSKKWKNKIKETKKKKKKKTPGKLATLQ